MLASMWLWMETKNIPRFYSPSVCANLGGCAPRKEIMAPWGFDAELVLGSHLFLVLLLLQWSGTDHCWLCFLESVDRGVWLCWYREVLTRGERAAGGKSRAISPLLCLTCAASLLAARHPPCTCSTWTGPRALITLPSCSGLPAQGSPGFLHWSLWAAILSLFGFSV